MNGLANERGSDAWFNTWNLEPIAGELRDHQESAGSYGIDEGKALIAVCGLEPDLENVARR